MTIEDGAMIVEWHGCTVEWDFVVKHWTCSDNFQGRCLVLTSA
jgi:hypothetical protein